MNWVFFGNNVFKLYMYVTWMLCWLTGLSAFFDASRPQSPAFLDRHPVARAIVFSIAWPIIGTAHVCREVKRILSS